MYGSLLTVDGVVRAAYDKRVLRLLGVDTVDMEASGVAVETAARRLPFFCVRVISDEAGGSLPIDFNKVRRPDGTFSGWRVFARALTYPSCWGGLCWRASSATRGLTFRS